MSRRRPNEPTSRLVGRLALSVLALGVLSLGCASPRPNVPRPTGALDPRRLAGTWYVLESNFPMWADGKKTDPAFRYGILEGEDGVRLDDRVSYREGGREASIDGIDTPDPRDSSHFTWRGKGLLRLFSSEWYVTLLAPDASWAVIYFSSTIATPEGVDVIARTPSLPAGTMEMIRRAIAEDPALRAKAKGLAPVRRSRIEAR